MEEERGKEQRERDREREREREREGKRGFREEGWSEKSTPHWRLPALFRRVLILSRNEWKSDVRPADVWISKECCAIEAFICRGVAHPCESLAVPCLSKFIYELRHVDAPRHNCRLNRASGRRDNDRKAFAGMLRDIGDVWTLTPLDIKPDRIQSGQIKANTCVSKSFRIACDILRCIMCMWHIIYNKYCVCVCVCVCARARARTWKLCCNYTRSLIIASCVCIIYIIYL